MYPHLLFLGIFLGSLFTVNEHEFYLSKTNINYDSKEQAVQIATRIFLDDLELSLKEQGHDSLHICTKKEKENVESLIFDYLIENLIIAVDGQEVEYEFLGKEPSDDLAAVWCYLEAYDVSSFNTIEISNTILTDQFEEQRNVTIVQVDKEQLAYLLFTADKTYEAVEK